MRVEHPRLGFELIKRFFHIPRKIPEKIQIEITNKCNLSCEMCPRKDYKLPNKHMEFSDFKKYVDKLNDVEVIIPVGWGEAFVHPDIVRIIDYLKKKNHVIKLTTNGLLLDNKRLFDAAMKIDYLSFSLDEVVGGMGHQNEKTVKIIKKIMQQKKRPYITIQPVIYKKNNKVLDVVRLAGGLGVDRVNIVRPLTKFDKSLKNSYAERKKVYKQVEMLRKKFGIRVDMLEYASFTGLKRVLWKYFKGVFRMNSWCNRLYDFAYVTLDGKITPCCATPRLVVGDLNKQSLKEIWTSEKMQQFRKNHKKICKDCDVLKIK